MAKQYKCPYCDAHLKVGENIVLIGRNKHGNQGLLLLHPEIGNYTSMKHPEFKIEANEALDLSCPCCHKSLISDFDQNLSHLILLEDQKHFDIYFSKIHGEQSTYLVNGDKVTATGEHSDRYTYFKMSDKFKQYLKK